MDSSIPTGAGAFAPLAQTNGQLRAIDGGEGSIVRHGERTGVGSPAICLKSAAGELQGEARAVAAFRHAG
jgi:hypothetical protein